MKKNTIFKIIISMLLSALCVWFIIAFFYMMETGKVLHFAISGSILVFIGLTFVFTLVIDEVSRW